jgi:hypothetical protein
MLFCEEEDMEERLAPCLVMLLGLALLGFTGCGGGASSAPAPSPVGEWTWVSGSNLAGKTGTYGTPGVPSFNIFPGCRDSMVGWTDKSGNLWLFGGGDYLSIAYGGKFDDLWEYQP